LSRLGSSQVTGSSSYSLAFLTRSVFHWVWPHFGQTDTTLLPGVVHEVLCASLFTLPISQSRAKETHWPDSSLCGRKLSNPLPVCFKRLNSGWLWPRRLAVRLWGGEPLKPWCNSIRAAVHLLYFHVYSGRKHWGVTYLQLFQNTFREGRKVSRAKGDRQETAEKQSGLLPVSAILTHNSLMNLLNSLGWADPVSVSITALMKRTPCREAFRTRPTRGITKLIALL